MLKPLPAPKVQISLQFSLPSATRIINGKRLISMDLLPGASETELNVDKEEDKDKEKEKNKDKEKEANMDKEKEKAKEKEVALTIDEEEEVEDKQTPDALKKTSTYASKKAVAQRMMDIALLTSNANQLRYVLRYGTVSASFGISVALIALSLALQVLVGIFLIFRVKGSSTRAEKEHANSLVVGGVFLITIVNVLTTAFSLEEPGLLSNDPGLSTTTAVRTLNFTDFIDNSHLKNVGNTGK